MLKARGGTPKAHKHKHFIGISLITLLGFIIRGVIWDIPALLFACVLFWGPNGGRGIGGGASASECIKDSGCRFSVTGLCKAFRSFRLFGFL